MSRLTLGISVSAVVACGPKSDGVETTDSGVVMTTDATGTGDGDGVSATSGSSDATGTTAGADVCAAKGWTASWEAFVAARDASGGQYWYEARRTVFDDFGIPACNYVTTIIVDGGVVVERRLAFVGGTTDGDPDACTTEDFVEMGDAVGTSEADGVAPPLLLETLYAGCCEQALKIEPADDYATTFEVDAAGIMSRCYYTMLSCGEGCSGAIEGYGLISLDEVGFGPPPP